MAAKKCPKCGNVNPRFFTNCVECGTKLDTEVPKTEKTGRYLKAGLVLCLFLVLVIFVALPAARYSVNMGENFSRVVSSERTDAPVIESSLNRPVGNNNLIITVNSARDGENTYNSNKFFIVTVSLKNIRESGNVQVSNSDFELIDSEGTRYFPYSIGSKVIYDISPSQDTTADLTFIIPGEVSAERILFTFPGTSALSSDRYIVTFMV